MRADGRTYDALRPTAFELGIQRNAAGSVLVSTGRTRVICSASIEYGAPRWKKEPGGWVTAEYAMLPGSGGERVARKPSSRATEIQRLIGRALRTAVDLEAVGPHTITIDCDVLDADGGTRTAAITGGWVALSLACDALVAKGALAASPIRRQVAAVSVGIVKGLGHLDLDYSEDSTADTDLNLVGALDGDVLGLVEVQGTAERAPFSRNELNAMLDLGEAGIRTLMAAQRRALER
jgi:ribonuclease PH